MRNFLSIADEAKPAAPATECGSCSSGVKVGGEDISVVTKTDKGPEQNDTEIKEAETVVMTGPLGSAVTEALNKTLAKKVAGVGNESLAHIQANGQIYRPDDYLTSISRAVGVVPRVDDRPTAVNMLLDAASKVDEIEFSFATCATQDAARVPVANKSLLYETKDLVAGMEGYAVDAVEVVVRLRKVKA